jgi:hypothetical protein
MEQPAEIPGPRCGVCGQPLTAAGSACPRCAAKSGDSIDVHAVPGFPARRRPVRHPQTLASVLTFCFGLLLVPVILSWWGIGPLTQLNSLRAVTVAAMLLYLLLRVDEGDFRALFCVSLIIFVAQEALVYASRAYGTLSFQGLAVFLAFASAIYSSLALTAAAYDAQQAPQDRYHWLTFLACLSVLVLSLLRALSPTFVRSPQAWLAQVGARLEPAGDVILGVAALGLAYGLLKTYSSRGISGTDRTSCLSPNSPAPAEHPPAPRPPGAATAIEERDARP